MKRVHEPDCINMVAEFHETFDLKISSRPSVDDVRINKLRTDLIKEELEELEEALIDGDRVAALDALCDLQYVLSGAILSLGFQNIFSEAFYEVHRSNMTKACGSMGVAHMTGAPLGMGQYEIIPKNGRYVVKRNDGKVIKSVYYEPADLKTVIEDTYPEEEL